jgi:hypothetical protein
MENLQPEHSSLSPKGREIEKSPFLSLLITTFLFFCSNRKSFITSLLPSLSQWGEDLR